MNKDRLPFFGGKRPTKNADSWRRDPTPPQIIIQQVPAEPKGAVPMD
jgi:hypothetical protein